MEPNARGQNRRRTLHSFYRDRFDDLAMPGEMQVTITLRPVACGTELSIVQENIPPQIPVEFCYLGW